MKKELYWTLVRRWTSFDVMKVTSEKRDQLYGSTRLGSSHARKSDCYGQFPTEQAANAASYEIVAAYGQWQKDKEPAYKMLAEAESKYFATVREIVRRAQREAETAA